MLINLTHKLASHSKSIGMYSCLICRGIDSSSRIASPTEGIGTSQSTGLIRIGRPIPRESHRSRRTQLHQIRRSTLCCAGGRRCLEIFSSELRCSPSDWHKLMAMPTQWYAPVRSSVSEYQNAIRITDWIREILSSS